MLLAAFAVEAVAGAGTNTCHADVLVKNLDASGIPASNKDELGQKVAEAIALESGIGQEDVQSLDHKPGRTNLLNTGQVAPWLPASWKTAVESTGGAPSTMAAGLITDCSMVGFMSDIFKNPKVHATIVDTILSFLAETDANSKAVVGKLSVIATNVVSASSAVSAPAAPSALPATTSLAATSPTKPPSAPLLAATVAPPPAVMAPDRPEVPEPSGNESGMSGTPWWGWVLLILGVCLLVASCVSGKDMRKGSRGCGAARGYSDLDEEAYGRGH